MSPSTRTNVSEIVTGLGMAGIQSLLSEDLFARLPSSVLNVGVSEWQEIAIAFRNGNLAEEFKLAFDNGEYFLNSDVGLRGRQPYRIEWKGVHRSIGDETIPTDLRVNWVYLVSCKYNSKVLHNASPKRLFKGLLGDKEGKSENWYESVAYKEFHALYANLRKELLHQRINLPEEIQQLTPNDKKKIGNATKRVWPDSLKDQYVEFSNLVSFHTIRIWKENLATKRKRQQITHRLIRLCPCPYFVLGSSRSKSSKSVRLRIDSPWDWNQRFELLDFEVHHVETGQPRVDWKFFYKDKESLIQSEIKGHVEIRWSHGRFNGNPEAKVYLDSEFQQVPGYNPL